MKVKVTDELSLKRPAVTPGETDKDSKRKEYEDLIIRAQDSVHAFAILMDSGLYSDALHHLKFTFVNVASVILFPKAGKMIESGSILQNMEDRTDDISYLFINIYKSYLKISESSDMKKELTLLRPRLQDLWKKVSASSLRLIKSDYTTPKDVFFERITYFTLFSGIIIFLGLLAVFFLKLDSQLVNDIDQAVLFYTSDPGQEPAWLKRNIRTISLNTDWMKISHNLNAPERIRRIRLSPVSQVKLRFQIREIRFYGNGNGLRFTYSLVYNAEQSGYPDRIIYQGLIQEKLIPGEPPEFLSTEKKNFIEIKGFDLRNIERIEYDIRFLSSSQRTARN